MENLFYTSILKNIDEYIVIKDEKNNIIYSNNENMNKFSSLENNDEINFKSEIFKCKLKNIIINNEKYIMYQFINITREKQLEKISTIDYRTNLYNINGLKTNIDKFLEKNEIGCIIMIDLDNFKQINDSYTHAAGDYILKEVSNIFLKNTTSNDLVARYGGDEFIIILNKNLVKSFKIVEKIRKEIDSKKFKFNNNLIHVTATIGVKEFNYKDNINDIINNADILMYHGKNSGKNKTVID